MSHFKVRADAMVASPNVVPMADIMLVLLIIFMVVTPMITNSETVDLAKVANPIDMPAAGKDDAIIVAISRDGTIFLGNTKTAFADISSQLRERIAGSADKPVFTKSDARTKYGDVVKLVDKVRSSGVDNVGLITEKIDPHVPASPM